MVNYYHNPKTRFLPNIFLLLILIPAVYAQNYLWPTNASRYMSSSFCEFRVGHYHSAIDIKTWLQEGYKCFAIEDGEISLIRVSPFGYGKVLYLHLKDGNTAVYAHLQRFSPEIEARIRKKQLANKKYSISWSQTGISVKKGDIIAYTGRTGIGVPHLHFEIRNSRGKPVNPLAFYDDVKDNLSPILQQLAVIPLDREATVNNNYLPQIFDLTQIKSGKYRVNELIRIKGRIGLAIRGFDRANDVGNKYGFHKTQLQLNQKTIFEMTYDELDFTTTEHIFTEIHYPLWATLKARFHKLYVEPFNPLSFYTRFPDTDGSISIGDSILNFQIDIQDFHGNHSTVEGKLDFDRLPIHIRNYERTGNWAFLEFESEPFGDLSIFTGPDPGQLKSVNYFEITDGKIYKPEDGLKLKIDLEDSLDQFLKLTMLTSDTRKSVSVLAPSPPDSLRPNIHYLGDRLLVELNNHSYPLNLNVSGKTVPFKSTDSGRFQALVPDSVLLPSPVRLSITSNNFSIWEDSIALARLYPDCKQVISWFDSALTIVSEPGTVIEPLLISANRYESAMNSDSLPIASKIFQINPKTVILFKRMEAFFLTDSLSADRNWGLFRISDSGKLSFSTDLERLSARRFRGRIGSPGKYIVACDTFPPVLDITSPKNGAVYDNWPAVKFHLKDQHSGIGAEENISILLDGEFILPEWDPEDELVEAVIYQPLAKGTHTLSVSISDRSSNTIRKALFFTIR